MSVSFVCLVRFPLFPAASLAATTLPRRRKQRCHGHGGVMFSVMSQACCRADLSLLTNQNHVWYKACCSGPPCPPPCCSLLTVGFNLHGFWSQNRLTTLECLSVAAQKLVQRCRSCFLTSAECVAMTETNTSSALRAQQISRAILQSKNFHRP